jgi:alpha-tubulin suppressor-like RCC1 family protein
MGNSSIPMRAILLVLLMICSTMLQFLEPVPEEEKLENLPKVLQTGGSGGSNVDLSSISAGKFHTCGILNNGSAMCWGSITNGRLGLGGDTPSSSIQQPDFVDIPPGRTVLSISAAYDYSCAVLDDGSAMCWGKGGTKLGNGSGTNDSFSPISVSLPSGRTLKTVDADGARGFTCGIADNNSLICWGGIAGGYGGTKNTPDFITLPGNSNVSDVSTGYYHLCAVLENGSAVCWGLGSNGRLGNGGTNTESSPNFVELPIGRTVVDISSGYTHSCAVMDNGSAMCWGGGSDGQLGNGLTSDKYSPEYVILPPGRTAISIDSGYDHSCAVLDNGSAVCWGLRSAGNLGDGNTSSGFEHTPVYVQPLNGLTILEISAGSGYTCAIFSDNASRCWGGDSSGRLGNGVNSSNSFSPSIVVGGHSWKTNVQGSGGGQSANGDISASLEFDYVNMRLKGNWQASNLVTGHDYNVSWTLEYQDNGTDISNGWPDSFNPATSNYSSLDRTWSSGFVYGEAICYEVVLRDGDGFTGPSLDSASSCVRTPVQLEELTSSEVINAAQLSSVGNCWASSSHLTTYVSRMCDNNTATEWVSGSETNNAEDEIEIDYDLGTSAVEVDAVAAYVNNAGYSSTIKDVRLQFLNQTGDYQTIGVFQIQQVAGWQYFGGFSVMTTDIRWDILSNHGYTHTVLFESKILDLPDRIFNSSNDWQSQTETGNIEAISLGDVNGNGLLDLALGENTKSIHLNSGLLFNTSEDWNSNLVIDTKSIAWGDIDGDGDLDLASANYNNYVEVYFNENGVLSSPPGWISESTQYGLSVAWGDIDGDGDLDLAVGNRAEENQVYLNTGGNLSSTPMWSNDNNRLTHAVAWGDIDGDGDLDLICGNYGKSNEIYLNNGGNLSSTADWQTSNTLNTMAIEVGDIDGDGRIDIVFGNTADNENELYLNSEDGLESSPSWTSSNGQDTVSVALGDVDGDGDLDLFVGNGNQHPDELYLNLESSGHFSSSSAWVASENSSTNIVKWGDVDSDGDLDIVIARSSYVEVFFNQLNNGGAGEDGLPDIDIVGTSDSDSGGKNLATGYSHNCAIQKNQTISCWGSNQYGQLGSDQYGVYDYSSPLYDVDLPQGTVPISVTAGWEFTCAILSGTSTDAYCWGRGQNGRLGNGDDSDSSIPADKVGIPGDAYPVDISSGYEHSCLVSQDGDVYCWGSNSHGQLGNGTSGGYSSTAGIVNGPNVDYTSVAVGEHHSCALTTEDDLYCWGHNGQGQLGDGTWSSSATPVLVSGSITWKSVVPNGMAGHSCAISSSDELYCWGSNGEGQLGDGSYSPANTPQLVQLQSSATSKVVDASVGSFGTSCAFLEDSSTYCWGINARGNLGDGTWQHSTTPVSVSLPEGSEVLEISSGREHSCVLLESDQIMCWGIGNWGVIGNGKYDDAGHPNYVSGEREWNGLGKDFFHLPTSVSIGTDNSVPKLESSVSFTSLPTSLNVDISSRVYFSHGQQILFFSPTEVEQNQPVNGLSWSNEYSFHDELPSITGGNDYCIEIHLNSNLTGDSIGYGLDCVWYNPPSSQDDFAPDDFEDVWGTSTTTQDSDGDGYEDWFEYWFGGDPLDSEVKPSDADMDGLPDALELAINSDENSVDTDGDGHEDIDELIYGGHPLKPWTVPPNYDYDDCYDYWENWNGLNTSNSDTDGDGVIDCMDTDSLDPDNTPVDSDGDGMPDDMEEEFGSDPENWDSDGDGMPDSFEYIMDTDPNSDQSWSPDWAMDWSTVLSFGQDVSITASSSHSEHPASLAIDSNSDTNGNQETYWQTNGYCPATLEVDLGRAQYFSTIDFLVKDIGDQNFPRNISIEYRETTEDTWNLHAYWERNVPGANGDYWDGMYAEMPFSKARYVRLNCTDSTDSESNSWEIAIASFRVYGIKNTQYINPDGGDGGDGGGVGQPSVEAFLNIDPANQTLTAGYSAQLNGGLDYDIEWRLIEANEGSCSDVPVSIDQGTVNLMSWDTAYNGTFQQIPVDYSTISDWYDEFCLQVDLMQGGNSLYVDWLLIDTSSGQNTGSNGSNQTQTDTDGDGVDDLIDLCAGTAPGVQVDSTGCPIGDPTTHNTTISVEFIEQKVDGVWNQKIELLVLDPWRGYNHSLSLKLEDSNGNTLYSYFSPIDEDAQDGWWILFTDSDEDEIEWKLDLNWEGVLEGGYWQSSSRFFEDVEYPYFEAGEYCVEVSLGYQINASDTAMSAVKNLIDKLQFCGTFEHDSMDGASWDGVVEPEQGLVDKVASNAIVSAVMDFMNSTTGQIVSILLGVLAFAGRMVLARGQRAKNKRVRKLSERIRKAETIGRLKIIEMDVEKANDKNKLPRGGYGDLMEQIEAQMERLGFDGSPNKGETSGNWSSDEGANEWQDDFQQAADMMWEAQDMMAEAKEEAAMARQAIEDMQQQMGHAPQRASPKQEPEPEEAFSSRYVTSGIDSSAAGAAGPSLPSARIMDLDGDGVVSPEEKEIWNAMTQEERAEFFSPITNIGEEIRRRQILNEKREKMNKKRGGGKKDKKRKKKDKKW